MKYLKYFKIYESIDIDNSYEYYYSHEDKGIADNNEFICYYYKFKDVKNREYYCNITIFLFCPNYMTVDFQDIETYNLDNRSNKDILNRTYINTNRNDAKKVINTVFKIIKDFCESNEDITHLAYTADEKRRRIYYIYINSIFPNNEVEIDEYLEEKKEYMIQIKLNK